MAGKKGYRTNEVERFMKKVMPEPNSGCWLWMATCNSAGYGTFWSSTLQKNDYAHRVSHRLFIAPVSAEMQVLHSCDNPACVNPDHLRLGTPKDNMQDKIKKGRHPSIYPASHRKAYDAGRKIRKGNRWRLPIVHLETDQ